MNFVLKKKKILGNSLTICENINELKDNKSKMVVKFHNNKYHVFISNGGRYYIEKKLYSYPNILDYVLKKSKKTYFIDCDYDKIKIIKNKNRISLDDYQFSSNEYVYLKDEDDNTIKTKISLKRETLLKLIDNAYNLTSHYMQLTIVDLLKDYDEYKDVCYPLVSDNNNNIILPSSEDNPVFYLLNRFYSKDGEKIYLNTQDLKDLESVRNKDNSKYIDNIINELQIEELFKLPKEAHVETSKIKIKKRTK